MSLREVRSLRNQMAKKKAKAPKTEFTPEAIQALNQLRAMGCLLCNGTQEICNQCGEASNVCDCGGVDEGDTIPCECSNKAEK